MSSFYRNFIGSELRLARILNNLTLEQVASHVNKTRQYIHKLETGQAIPNSNLTADLAQLLKVKPEMFSGKYAYTVRSDRDLLSGSLPYLIDEQFHFRSLRTAKHMLKHQVQTRGEMIVRLIFVIEKYMKLPKYNLSEFCLNDFKIENTNDIERLAEKCRNDWDLGLGSISNMYSLAENLGIIVTNFSSIAHTNEIDALSIDSKRPAIVIPTFEQSICRQRFDIGHEIGHLIMHQGVLTGDRITESQAHRFASALLIPRSMMAKRFPAPKGLSTPRFNWEVISEFKQYWKVSKSAILYRARQLDLITEAQHKSAIISLRNGGESKIESEDNLIPHESPELLQNAFQYLALRKKIYGDNIADDMGITVALLEDIIGFNVPRKPIATTKLSLVE